MTKNKNLTIYLMKTNKKNFKDYLKEDFRDRVKKHLIDKQSLNGNIDKGIIFIYEEKLNEPEWISYLNTLAIRKDIKVSKKRVSKAVVFLTIKGNSRQTFAITFGNGYSLLNSEFIVPDFGLRVSKSLLSIKKIISIDSMSIDRKIYNSKKQSSAFLIPERLLEYGSQNIVRNVYGVYTNVDNKFSLGGNDNLNFKGDINLLSELGSWLEQFSNLYTDGKNNLGLFDDLVLANKQDVSALDQLLATKVLDIISSSTISGRQIYPIKIIPHETIDLDNFNGFFISGLGYKPSNLSSDFYIDEVNFFERFKRQIKTDKRNNEGVLSKLKTDKILIKKTDNEELISIGPVYKAIQYEVTYKSKKYILVSGTWYEIDKDFYKTLKNDIDSIKKPDSTDNVNFPDFNAQKHFRTVTKNGKLVDELSEGEYNKDLVESNYILLLDQRGYTPDKETMRTYGFKINSNIELCDALYFNDNKIQFIHVKRHSGASGTSHLLSQALVSANVFVNDNQAVLGFINEEIDRFNANNRLYNLLKLKYKNQNNEIVLAIIEGKKILNKPNSKLLSILEMIAIRENIRQLEYLGFKCYLKFIPTN